VNLIFSLILKTAIIIYQRMLSPLLPKTCRFTPTCSEYGLDAITKFGAFKGLVLLSKRILRCHPWGGEGHDPV